MQMQRYLSDEKDKTFDMEGKGENVVTGFVPTNEIETEFLDDACMPF